MDESKRLSLRASLENFLQLSLYTVNINEALLFEFKILYLSLVRDNKIGEVCYENGEAAAKFYSNILE